VKVLIYDFCTYTVMCFLLFGNGIANSVIFTQWSVIFMLLFVLGPSFSRSAMFSPPTVQSVNSDRHHISLWISTLHTTQSPVTDTGRFSRGGKILKNKALKEIPTECGFHGFSSGKFWKCFRPIQITLFFVNFYVEK